MISEWNFSTDLPCSFRYRIVVSDGRTEYAFTNVQKLRLHPGTGKPVATGHVQIPVWPLRVVSSRGITWSWSEMHAGSQAGSHAGFPASESVLPQDPLVTGVARQTPWPLERLSEAPSEGVWCPLPAGLCVPGEVAFQR